MYIISFSFMNTNQDIFGFSIPNLLSVNLLYIFNQYSEEYRFFVSAIER